MQVVSQLKPEKGGINWDKVHIEGRTRKACQNTWGKFMSIHKAQQEGAAGENAGDPSSPAKAKKPSKDISVQCSPFWEAALT